MFTVLPEIREELGPRPDRADARGALEVLEGGSWGHGKELSLIRS